MATFPRSSDEVYPDDIEAEDDANIFNQLNMFARIRVAAAVAAPAAAAVAEEVQAIEDMYDGIGLDDSDDEFGVM